MTRAWTHVVCWLCWWRLTEAARHPPHEPVRVKESREEPCCFCGAPTSAGIFLRRDPAAPELRCQRSARHATG